MNAEEEPSEVEAEVEGATELDSDDGSTAVCADLPSTLSLQGRGGPPPVRPHSAVSWSAPPHQWYPPHQYQPLTTQAPHAAARPGTVTESQQL